MIAAATMPATTSPLVATADRGGPGGGAGMPND
jgi:hypothetical protein